MPLRRRRSAAHRCGASLQPSLRTSTRTARLRPLRRLRVRRRNASTLQHLRGSSLRRSCWPLRCTTSRCVRSGDALRAYASIVSYQLYLIFVPSPCPLPSRTPPLPSLLSPLSPLSPLPSPLSLVYFPFIFFY